MRWTAIWHNDWPLLPPPVGLTTDRPLAELTLFLELTVPPARGRIPLRLWQGSGDPSDAIALYLMPGGALRLVHGDIDLNTEDDFARAGETICLRYRACARGRHDEVDLRNMDRQTRQRLRAAHDQKIRLSDAMPRDLRFLEICHIAAIAPFGIGPTDMPGLESGTQVLTPDGPAAVETLRRGSKVITTEGEVMPLRWIDTRPHLCLGRLAPIRLRAPYFGLEQDICVTAQTRILRTGPAVEYLCGTDAVLVEARDLVAKSGARPDRRQPVRVFHHLMLDDHTCLKVDRCAVETALLADVIRAEDMAPRPFLADSDKTPCVPVLDRFTAQALATVGERAHYGRR